MDYFLIDFPNITKQSKTYPVQIVNNRIKIMDREITLYDCWLLMEGNSPYQDKHHEVI